MYREYESSPQTSGLTPAQEASEFYDGHDMQLEQLLNELPQRDNFHDSSADITDAHIVLLDPSKLASAKENTLRNWLSRFQPCVFGRSGSMGKANLGIDICMISQQEMMLGSNYIRRRIQRARQDWKDKAEYGMSSGFLIFFNDERLARAIHSVELVRAAQSLSELYLVEQGKIETDVIYTEAIPLRMPDGQLTLYKAGCNIFYTGAERTLNHDRRVPGGLLMSMNSPGHYATSLHIRGKNQSHEGAVAFVRDLAFRSIGNGGIGHTDIMSNSWHNRTGTMLPNGCPIKNPPSYIPQDVNMHRYSALYHTDVLIPSTVMSDQRDYIQSREDAEIWPHLIIDYITTQEFPESHPNYALFRGHPICEEQKYDNPWPARRAHNNEVSVD